MFSIFPISFLCLFFLTHFSLFPISICSILMFYLFHSFSLFFLGSHYFSFFPFLFCVIYFLHISFLCSFFPRFYGSLGFKIFLFVYLIFSFFPCVILGLLLPGSFFQSLVLFRSSPHPIGSWLVWGSRWRCRGERPRTSLEAGGCVCLSLAPSSWNLHCSCSTNPLTILTSTPSSGWITTCRYGVGVRGGWEGRGRYTMGDCRGRGLGGEGLFCVCVWFLSDSVLMHSFVL